MLTKKDRKIKNQEAMIENRNVLIADMEKQAKALYEENKDIESKLNVAEEIINRIIKLADANKYSNEKVFFDKIKELVSDYQSTN